VTVLVTSKFASFGELIFVCSLSFIFAHTFTRFLSKFILSARPLSFWLFAPAPPSFSAASAAVVPSGGISVISIPLTLMLLFTHFIF